MKFFFHKKNTQHIEYNIRLIEKLLAGNITKDVSLADYVLCSICDVTEIGEIIKAKKYGPPVITGGMISEYPIANELSDYVWHGEIYGFKKEIDTGRGLEDMASITSAGERRLCIDQQIDWRLNPIIKRGNRAMYYYVSKGCPVRCKYCYISYSRKYQKVPWPLYKKASKVAGKNFMPIAAFNPFKTITETNIGETFLKEYVTTNNIKSATIRAGVEFVSESLSSNIAKGVTHEDFFEAIKKSEKNNTKMILYFIAGLEDQEIVEEYFSKIPSSFSGKAPISIVFTYIDPQPFTPFANFDISLKKKIDAKKIYRVVSQMNKRIRIMPLAKRSKSTIRTLIGRAESIEQYNHIVKLKNKSHEEIINECGKYKNLIGSDTIAAIIKRPRKKVPSPYWEEP